MKNRHVSSRELSEWILGQASEATRSHVRVCERCQNEAERMRDSLAVFGEAVREWSAARLNPGFRLIAPHAERSRDGRMLLGWTAVAVVIAICFVAILLIPRASKHPAGSSGPGITDTVLLQQVDKEVSRTVPAPMEPLMRLVSWDDSAANSRVGGNNTKLSD